MSRKKTYLTKDEIDKRTTAINKYFDRKISELEKKLHDYMEDDSKGKEKWSHQVYKKIDELRKRIEVLE